MIYRIGLSISTNYNKPKKRMTFKFLNENLNREQKWKKEDKVEQKELIYLSLTSFGLYNKYNIL
jgi:hypothetical protein